MKNLKFIIPAIIIILVGIVLIVFNITKEKEDDSKTTPSINENVGEETTNEELTMVVISINPKLVLEIDKDKNVKNMYPLNEDAKNFDRNQYIGKSITESIAQVLEDASEFLEKNNNITISITEGESISLDEIEQIIKEKDDKVEIKKEQLTETEKDEINNQIEEIKVEDAKEETNDEGTDETIKEVEPEKETETNKNQNSETNKENVTQTETKKSNNANLTSLTIENLTISFDKNNVSYSGIVNFDINSTNITAKTEDTKAKITGTGNKNLTVGNNLIEVKVTAEDGTIKTYKINIERRPQFNLNDNTKYILMGGVNTSSFVYPTNEACFGKNPYDFEIPDGRTYDDYCQNQVPTNFPTTVSGFGYSCQVTDGSYYNMSTEGMTASKPYFCEWIDEIADEDEMNNKIYSFLKVGNYQDVGGGAGGGDEITLTQEYCDKLNLTCGTW